jgi:hypothetical protein
VTLGVNAAIANKGKQTFAKAFATAEPLLQDAIVESLTRELQHGKLLALAPATQPADSELRLVELLYGFSQEKDENFHVAMIARFNLLAPDGHQILSRSVAAKSTLTVTASAPSQLVTQAVREAADHLAHEFMFRLANPKLLKPEDFY